MMTATEVAAIAESVMAAAALIAVGTWIVQNSRRALKWRKDKHRDYVLDIVLPACALTLVAAVILADILSKDGTANQ